MTKFTKEQLQEIAQTDHVQCGDAAAMARQLLAGLEQEPVIIVGNDGGDALAYRRLIQNFLPGTKLYAAPQLPQPAVISALDVSQLRAHFERWMIEQERCIVGSSDPYPAGIESRNWRAWKACRAAMLQADNSPVIPDGWVMVPVEPTAAMNKAGWAAINEHDEINPTYRAMLAAAPQW